jgi:hypothetical protein
VHLRVFLDQFVFVHNQSEHVLLPPEVQVDVLSVVMGRLSEETISKHLKGLAA